MSDVDPRVKLAYEESVRGLDMQNETLNELHSRTGVVIAAATVASGILGGSSAATASARILAQRARLACVCGDGAVLPQRALAVRRLGVLI